MMKRYGALIALALAVVFGLTAVVLANRWLSARNRQMTKEVSTVPVVVAARDLDIGTPLSAEHLVLTDWPKASLPKGAFHDVAAVKGRTILSKLWAGEPVLTPVLASPGSGAGMVATIGPGLRAMAVRVDEVTGVGGFILPNTFVDVIAVDDERQARSVKTLLHKIKVLAIAQETFTEDGKPKIVKTVTLELLPSQAEKLALQMHDGSIHLALRNPLDDAPPVPEPQPVAVARPAPRRTVYVTKEAPKPPPTFEVEVYRRLKKESVKFTEDPEEL